MDEYGKDENQKLSEERAAAVVQYLRNNGNVPMRRIVAPAGYGSTHPAAENTDPQGRALNRRVDVKVLLNKGTQEAQGTADPVGRFRCGFGRRKCALRKSYFGMHGVNPLGLPSAPYLLAGLCVIHPAIVLQ